MISQHSGEGKANQYSLRGFNLDYGTDFATTVAGMPVNMPTRTHGHGYSDLNFLIPELGSIGSVCVGYGWWGGPSGILNTARIVGTNRDLTGQWGTRRGSNLGSLNPWLPHPSSASTSICSV